MAIDLTPIEARVMGVLIEKEITTPEVYPMTLNAVTTGCNQKSNRDPVLSLSSNEVQTALDTLQQKKLVMKMPGQRSVKFMQRLCNTEFSAYQFSAQERAIICLLLVRGPQTPGELRTRSQRLADFGGVEEVDQVLNDLSSSDKGSLVLMLEREPGRRENRYATTLTSLPTHSQTQKPIAVNTNNTLTSARLIEGAASDHLQSQIDDLKFLVERLEERIELLEKDQQ